MALVVVLALPGLASFLGSVNEMMHPGFKVQQYIPGASKSVTIDLAGGYVLTDFSDQAPDCEVVTLDGEVLSQRPFAFDGQAPVIGSRFEVAEPMQLRVTCRPNNDGVVAYREGEIPIVVNGYRDVIHPAFLWLGLALVVFIATRLLANRFKRPWPTTEHRPEELTGD